MNGGKRLRWLLLATLLVAAPASAQEIHGFVEALNGVRLVEGSGFDAGTYTVREARLQLSVNDYGDAAEYFARVDLPFDQVAAETDEVELREAYFTYGGFSSFDLKIGRQILTWGTGDLLFINDVFPKDWQSFFIGRETQYLKAPMDALRFGVYAGDFDLNVALMPRFEPDRLPTAERLAFFDPLAGAVTPEAPANEVGNGEVAARLKRSVAGTEVVGYVFVGRFRQPVGFDPMASRLFYPRLNVYGASVRRAGLGGIVNAEVGYYQSRDDDDGTAPGVENSSLRWLVGFDRQLWTDTQLGVQGYFEHVQDYDALRDGLPSGAFVPEEVRQLVTLRLTRLLRYQTIRLSLFTFASPSDEDYHVRASASYKLNDAIELALGAHVFGGEHEQTLFGQLDDNDNVFVRARYAF